MADVNPTFNVFRTADVSLKVSVRQHFFIEILYSITLDQTSESVFDPMGEYMIFSTD